MKLNIETIPYEDGRIEQRISRHDSGGIIEVIYRQVMDTGEEQIRQALIKLGWTPPGKEIDENKLNDAGWAFIDAYNKHMPESIHGHLFNNLKPMLRVAIEKYLEKAA